MTSAIPRTRLIPAATMSRAANPARVVGDGILRQSLPILFFQLYLAATLVLFAFGPLDLPVENPTRLYGYAIAGQVAILFGFMAGSKTPAQGYSGVIRFPNLVQLTILVTIVILLIAMRFRNYGGITLIQALTDPSVAYYARLEQFESGESMSLLFSVVRAFSGPMLAIFTPIGIFYWRRMDAMWKGMWIAGEALFFFDCMITGAAKGLFDIVLVVPWLLWARPRDVVRQSASHVGGLWPAGSRGGSLRPLLVGVVTIAILVGGFGYFVFSRQARYGLASNSYPAGTTGWSQELYGVTIPEPVEFATYMVARYWTHGYFGLAGCLELPFEWSYGVGHSVVWMKYAGSFSSDPERFWRSCYPARLEEETGYSTAHYWHTIYPWIASDLSFPGALVFMGFMAYLLAQAWSDTRRGENPFALGFFSQLMLLFYYVPANNCRLMFSEEAVTFWTLLVAWRCTRR